MDDSSSPVPTARYEWERLVRRIVMPGPQKLMAFVLASYADPDGSRVRPGNDVLAAVTCQSEKNVRRLVGALKELGLLLVASRGGGRGGKGKATEYQLAIPVDLLERAALLRPGDRPVSPDIQVSGRNGSSPVDSPVDNPESPDIQVSTQFAAVIPIDRTSNTVTKPLTGHFQRMTGHPDVRLPKHYYQPPGPTLRAGSQLNHRPRARTLTMAGHVDDRPERLPRHRGTPQRDKRRELPARTRPLGTGPNRPARTTVRSPALARVAARRRPMPLLRDQRQTHRDRPRPTLVRRRTGHGNQPPGPVPGLQPGPQQLPDARRSAPEAAPARDTAMRRLPRRAVRPAPPQPSAGARVWPLWTDLGSIRSGCSRRAGDARVLRLVLGDVERDQSDATALNARPPKENP